MLVCGDIYILSGFYLYFFNLYLDNKIDRLDYYILGYSKVGCIYISTKAIQQATQME